MSQTTPGRSKVKLRSLTALLSPKSIHSPIKIITRDKDHNLGSISLPFNPVVDDGAWPIADMISFRFCYPISGDNDLTEPFVLEYKWKKRCYRYLSCDDDSVLES